MENPYMHVLTEGIEAHKAGRLSQAEAIYQGVLDEDPENAEALHLLGLAAYHGGRLDRAIARALDALRIDPGNAKYKSNLGSYYSASGDNIRARDMYRSALEDDPRAEDAHYNLGVVSAALKDWDGAIEAFRQAVLLDPGNADAHFNLGIVLGKKSLPVEAAACFRRAIDVDPGHYLAFNNLGVLLKDSGAFDDAVQCLEKAVALKADFGEAYANLGNALSELNELERALESYRTAMTLAPDLAEAKNNYLHTLLYLPGVSNERLFEEVTRVSRVGPVETLATGAGSGAMADDGRLRIGYLSSDFYDHPVALNVMPLLFNHDHQRFEVFCYARTERQDAVTERIRDAADHWRTVTALSDAEIAQQIHDDGIQVMVYLGGNFDANRPTVAAHRPAPVQVSMHAGTTTAVDGMDYWFSDSILHPESSTEKFTETLYRLPSFYAYPAPEDAPPISPLPADENGFVTFCSFNKPRKINDLVIDAWSEILTRVPDARLILKYKNHLSTPALRRRILSRFAANDISEGRINLISATQSFRDHMAVHHQADIALDTFPFGGATTTFHALWMGVPVISFMGERFVTGMGGSTSCHAGLENLTARTLPDYVTAAVELAADIPRLRALRSSMRERLLSSPVCDGPAYARNLEQAFLSVWNDRPAPV